MYDKDAIVFINQNAGYLMIDIIHAHADYPRRTIIAGKLIERNAKLDKGVKFEKIIAYNRSSSFKRLFTWSWGFIQILWLVKVRYRKAELFIVTNPPLASLIPLFVRNVFSLLVYDVYPDALIAYKKIDSNSLISRFWKKSNKNIFKKAKNIFTISDGIKKVLCQYIDPDKIKVIPVWTDNSFLKPVPKAENKFIQNYSLENKFLVMYSGNLGHSHPVEVLLEIAAAIKDKDIYFVIIGEGDKQKLIRSLIEKKSLINCILLPWQEVEMLPYSLAAADIGVVTLSKESSSLSIPSKTFNLMSVGVPIMGIADSASELSNLINNLQIGKCFHQKDIEQMISFIEFVKSNRDYKNSLQHNSLLASKQFGSENALKFVSV